MSLADVPAIEPLGDRALILRFGKSIDATTSDRVACAWRSLAAARIPGVVDLVPAYATVTVHYDWQRLPEAASARPWHWLAGELRAALSPFGDIDSDSGGRHAPREIEIPVCYQGEHAPDLDAVARETGLTAAEVVRRHGGREYQVAFLGFRPGFPYLLGLDPALAVARLADPRPCVPAGSVGLAGNQTGIYPTAGAGGWRLIGRTPLPLFDPARSPPTLLAPGDRLRFVPIDAAGFERIAREREAQPATMQRPGDAIVFEVVASGVHTTMQDAGRSGLRHLGVAAGGASDAVARSLANALVGNDAASPVLEMTLRGPTLRALRAATIALAGCGMQAFAGDETIPFARPVRLAEGAVLSFRPTGEGARAWLAVAGGFSAPQWLGSVSADSGSGLFGQPLAAGDRLSLATPDAPVAPAAGRTASFPSWWIDAAAEIDSPMILRFVIDGEAEAQACDQLAARVWRVSNAADRTGTRLEGAALDIGAAGARISAGVLHGSIQVPPNGLPILLGPDCQTTGGYPVIGHVIEADLPRLAQLKPGDLVWLQPFALEDAHAARVALATTLARLRVAVAARLRDAAF